MKHKRLLLELTTVATAIVVYAMALRLDPGVPWGVVLAFGAFVVLAENTSVLMHGSTSVSPGFMIMMAAIGVLTAEHDGGVLAGAGLVGACGGLYIGHLRSRRSLIAFNCAQHLLASLAAALVYTSFDSVNTNLHLAAAVLAALAYGAVNISIVLPEVALIEGERLRTVWAGMRPVIPNYLAFGLLGLLLGQLSTALEPMAIVLLAVPFVIGRSTFASFKKTREAHDATIRLFIRLIEAKDAYTAGHTERVAKYSLYVAEELDLSPDAQEHLRQSALMHDVGKLAVPTRLLNKPGKLTPEEWEVVRRHNEAGIGILARIDFMRTMAVTASDRHGHYEDHEDAAPPELVLEAHIVAVADAFDAMTSTRSYRRALDQDVAFEELRRNAGTQFNPRCVEALIRAIEGRGERYGAGFEVDAHDFAVPPPAAGVGSAGLGNLADEGRA